MTFSGDEHYPVTPEAAFERMCRVETVTARYEAMGDRDVVVDRCEADGDGWIIVSRRTVDVDLPGFAKKVLSPTNTMTQTDRWGPPEDDGRRTGTFEVDVAGAPVQTYGTMRLEPDGAGCRHFVTGEIEVNVPLVGGRISKWAGGTAAQTMADEFAFHRRLFDG